MRFQLQKRLLVAVLIEPQVRSSSPNFYTRPYVQVLPRGSKDCCWTLSEMERNAFLELIAERTTLGGWMPLAKMKAPSGVAFNLCAAAGNSKSCMSSKRRLHTVAAQSRVSLFIRKVAFNGGSHSQKQLITSFIHMDSIKDAIRREHAVLEEHVQDW